MELRVRNSSSDHTSSADTSEHRALVQNLQLADAARYSSASQPPMLDDEHAGGAE